MSVLEVLQCVCVTGRMSVTCSILCAVFSLCEDAPNITFPSGEQTVLVNSSVNISCRVDTFPSSTITWYLDNEEVSSYLVTTQSVDSRTQESRVTISSVGTEDSGTYRCEASNLLSTVNMNTTLTVESESNVVT